MIDKNLIKFTPIGLCILSFIVRIIYISSNSIGGDEAFSIYHAQMDLSSLVHHFSAENNPPLHEILLHFWIKLFGIGELSVRFPSLLFSVVTVYFIYKIGLHFFNYRIALFAGLLFSFSNYFIAYAHMARVYSLFGCLTAASMYVFLSLLKGDERKKIHYVILIIANVLLIYAHFFGFFVIFLQLLISMMQLGTNRQLVQRLLAYQFIVLLFYIPYFPILFERFFVSSHTGTWVKPVENLGNLHDMIFLFSNENKWVYVLFLSILWIAVAKYLYQNTSAGYVRTILTIYIPTLFFLTGASIFVKMPLIWRFTSQVYYSYFFVILIMAFVMLLLFDNLTKGSTLYSRIVSIWFLLPFLLMFSISFKYLPHNIPMFLDRYLIYLAIGFYLLLAISIYFIFSQLKYADYLMAIPILLLILSCNPKVDNKGRAKEVVGKIQELKDTNSIVVICPQHFILNYTYYYNQELFKEVDNENVYGKILSNLERQNIFAVNSINDLKLNLDSCRRIIYLDAAAEFDYPQNNIINTLERNYVKANTFNFPEIFSIYVFVKK